MFAGDELSMTTPIGVEVDFERVPFVDGARFATIVVPSGRFVAADVVDVNGIVLATAP